MINKHAVWQHDFQQNVFSPLRHMSLFAWSDIRIPCVAYVFIFHQIQTMQLFNHESVPCQWSIVEDVKPVKVLNNTSYRPLLITG